MFGDGFILLSPRHISLQSDPTPDGEEPLSWQSRYGSVSFYVKLTGLKNDQPDNYSFAGVDGMNEVGLKVGIYFLETSVFPKIGSNRTLAITFVMKYLPENFKMWMKQYRI